MTEWTSEGEQKRGRSGRRAVGQRTADERTEDGRAKDGHDADERTAAVLLPCKAARIVCETEQDFP
ncbi:MAG: hypothetical protein IIY42_00485 [Ruminococcus sp.]|uniref:hypothetical protein n=1 Tax=Ruminococcus sp. JE7B6 TaxID=3233380 RepID=UPI002E8D7D15|nr:hypothetical protein [Ruminococcus sp.]MBQ1587296.1 hypothetical protein [Ruminococcus sp.]MBQ2212178.1 hypothetical protein [Ruminococcus sp.]MBQ3299174.1 hypothetical protein [Ruminococcus sp.]MEE3473858.1 hypothetical protein [Ruminococcus sp.]